MQDKKIALDEKHIFNLIPGFLGSGKAATLASQTDEFKNAHNIGVHTGPSLHDIKLEVLLAGKSLFLPGARESSALCFRVDVPENFTDEQKKQILLNKDGQGRTEITVDNKVKLDMVFIGSVSVSRKGNRIGCGSDFTDLYMGLLIDVGLITSDTVIATLVHDVQVVKSLPECLFQKYDIPVDLIITPSQVIRVDRRDRPLGIFWDLLSEQHLKIMPILKLLKENQEKEDHTAAAIIAEVNVDHTAAAINAEVNVDTSAAAAIIAEVNVDTTSAAGIINVVDTPVAAIIGDATSV